AKNQSVVYAKLGSPAASTMGTSTLDRDKEAAFGTDDPEKEESAFITEFSLTASLAPAAHGRKGADVVCCAILPKTHPHERNVVSRTKPASCNCHTDQDSIASSSPKM